MPLISTLLHHTLYPFLPPKFAQDDSRSYVVLFPPFSCHVWMVNFSLLYQPLHCAQSDRIASRIIPFVPLRSHLASRHLFCYVWELGYQNPATNSSWFLTLTEPVGILTYVSAESPGFYNAAEFSWNLAHTTEWRKNRKQPPQKTVVENWYWEYSFPFVL